MASTKIQPFRLKTPCTHCPFRSDLPKFIHPERAQEIADSLYAGGEFPCHKTTEHVEHEDGTSDRVATPQSRFCAGALITMEKQGFSNQMVRIGERLGMYDPERLNMEAPVYGSLSEWVASYRTVPTVEVKDAEGNVVEVLEYEHCGVVADECEDPPGYSMGGGVAHSTEEPTCHPIEDCCSFCGHTMCPPCRGEDTAEGEKQCVFCEEEGTDG